MKMVDNKLWRFNIKNQACCYLDDLIIINDFEFGNIIFDEKSYENIFLYYFACIIS